MRKLVKPAYEDPHHSVDLFDFDALNDFGEMFCVAPSILASQVDFEWERYRDNQISALRHKSSAE